MRRIIVTVTSISGIDIRQTRCHRSRTVSPKWSWISTEVRNFAWRWPTPSPRCLATTISQLLQIIPVSYAIVPWRLPSTPCRARVDQFGQLCVGIIGSSFYSLRRILDWTHCIWAGASCGIAAISMRTGTAVVGIEFCMTCAVYLRRVAGIRVAAHPLCGVLESATVPRLPCFPHPLFSPLLALNLFRSELGTRCGELLPGLEHFGEDLFLIDFTIRIFLEDIRDFMVENLLISLPNQLPSSDSLQSLAEIVVLSDLLLFELHVVGVAWIFLKRQAEAGVRQDENVTSLNGQKRCDDLLVHAEHDC
mmetsp:Transcript_134082/g.232974  ORF Transcript_134082/g.232974 Transcript_134082/m.232974 type:complete len:306 (+) Transcript_134082:177-1094(+)